MINFDNDVNIPNQEEHDTEVLEIMNLLVSSDENTPAEKDFFAKNIPVRRIKKGEFLVKEGQLIKASFHVYKGCFREFYHKNGEEKTTAFYITGDSLTEDGNKLDQNTSPVNWECVSEAIVSIFSFEVEKEMFKRFPRLESFCREGIESAYSKYKRDINNFLSCSPEERYETLMKTKPEVFQSVPLYHIASYLCIQPESLSRIRKRMGTPKPKVQ